MYEVLCFSCGTPIIIPQKDYIREEKYNYTCSDYCYVAVEIYINDYFKKKDNKLNKMVEEYFKRSKNGILL